MLKKAKKLIARLFITAECGALRCMPFLYSLFRMRSTSCTIMLTDRCNSRCVMCRQWRKPASDELSTEGWKDVLRQLKDIGIDNIHYTGGEPLLRNDLSELVSYSSRSGFTVGMTTNGVLLDRETLVGLIKAGLRSIVISIDALDADYDKIRGLPGAFPRVEDAAGLISEARAKFKIDASINYTLMRDTLESFNDVKRFADALLLPVSICLLDRSSYIFDIEENRKEFWIGKDGKFDDFLAALKKIKVKNPKSLLVNFPKAKFWCGKILLFCFGCVDGSASRRPRGF